MNSLKTNKRETKAAEKAQSKPLPVAVSKPAKKSKKEAIPEEVKKAAPAQKSSSVKRAVSEKKKSVVKVEVSKQADKQSPSKINLTNKQAASKSDTEVPSTESVILQPSKPTSSFFIFNKEKRSEVRSRLGEEIPQVEVAKELGRLWTALDDDAKQKYVDLNIVDKKRYDNQLSDLSKKGYFLLPNGQKSSEKRAPLKDDPRPKRATGPYCFFISEKLATVKQEEKLTLVEASKKCSTIWASLAEEEKAPFFQKADAEKKRRQKEMAEFDDKGYFTMADGSKSYEANKKSAPVREKAQTRELKSFGEPEEANSEEKKASKNSPRKATPVTKMASPRPKKTEEKLEKRKNSKKTPEKELKRSPVKKQKTQ